MVVLCPLSLEQWSETGFSTCLVAERYPGIGKFPPNILISLSQVRQEKTKLRVAVTTAGRNLKKCEERIVNMKKEIESCVERIKRCAADIQANEEDAKETLAEFEKLEQQLKVGPNLYVYSNFECVKAFMADISSFLVFRDCRPFGYRLFSASALSILQPNCFILHKQL